MTIGMALNIANYLHVYPKPFNTTASDSNHSNCNNKRRKFTIHNSPHRTRLVLDRVQCTYSTRGGLVGSSADDIKHNNIHKSSHKLAARPNQLTHVQRINRYAFWLHRWARTENIYVNLNGRTGSLTQNTAVNLPHWWCHCIKWDEIDLRSTQNKYKDWHSSSTVNVTSRSPLFTGCNAAQLRPLSNLMSTTNKT